MQLDQMYLLYTGDRKSNARPLKHFMREHSAYFKKVIYLCYAQNSEESELLAGRCCIATVGGFKGGMNGIWRSFFARREIGTPIINYMRKYPKPIVIWAQPSPFGLFALPFLARNASYVIPFIRGDIRANIRNNYPILGILGLGIIAEIYLKYVVGRFPFVIVAGSKLKEKYSGSEYTYIWRGTTHTDVSRREHNYWRYKLLFVGRLDKNKRCNDVIKAVALLKDRGRLNYTLDIVGAGTEERALKRLAYDLGVSNAVKFLGELNDDHSLLNKYLESDVILLTSLSEGTPKVVPEAMSRGCVVVTTRVGDLPYSLNESYCRFVKKKSPVDICNKICELEDKPRVVELLRKNGYRYANRYSLPNQVSELWSAFVKFIEDLPLNGKEVR